MRYEKLIVADRGAAEPISLGAALLTGKKVAADAINLLVMDHLEAMSFFERYERETTPQAKLAVAERLCTLLSIHMQVEEELVYPAAEAATGETDMVRHAEEEHDQGRALIERLRARSEVDDAFDDMVAELKAVILQHVGEEESDFFPRVRAAGLDLIQLGRRIAPRRLELLFDLTGRTAKDQAMNLDSSSNVDPGAPRNLGQEAAIASVSSEEALKLFVTGLQNIHAVKHEDQSMLKRQIERVESYPKLSARLQQNLAETEGQLARIESILDDLGETPSSLKDAAMTMMGNLGAMKNAVAGDEILKNSFETAALVQFEIAAYKSLLILGEAAGEADAIRQLQQCLNEERSFAAWLEDNLAGTVITHLQLRSAGERASR